MEYKQLKALCLKMRRDILEKMEFTPLIAPDLREMDAALFTE